MLEASSESLLALMGVDGHRAFLRHCLEIGVCCGSREIRGFRLRAIGSWVSSWVGTRASHLNCLLGLEISRRTQSDAKDASRKSATNRRQFAS